MVIDHSPTCDYLLGVFLVDATGSLVYLEGGILKVERSWETMAPIERNRRCPNLELGSGLVNEGWYVAEEGTNEVVVRSEED